MINSVAPQSGSLLLSEPFMLDPNFKRSVVLIAEHNEDGTVGYVMNQKSGYYLQDLIPELPNASFPVYVGGPVGNDTLHFIHRCNDRMHSGAEIAKGIFWGGNFETLKLLINNNEVEEGEVRFFLGYSGWDLGQLDKELKQNSWLVTNNYDSGFLFDDEHDNLWRNVILGLGPKYAHIVNFPENPQWN